MDPQEQLAIAQLCLSVGLIAFAIGYMHRRTKVDRYRESLFTLRDELFDYMWKQGLSYDLPAYRLMRAFLNGAIRVAGDVTPLSFVAIMLAVSRHAPARHPLAAAIEAIEDPSTRERFVRTRSDFVRALLAFLGPIGLIIRLAVKLDRFKRTVREQVDRWINDLVVLGSEDSVARPLFAGGRSRMMLRR